MTWKADEINQRRLYECVTEYVIEGYNRAQEERQEAQEKFRESAQVLVSTDAGGEGLNLQFCHVVINYDLPWNPMRLEQRIGRVDRIGQSHDVRALNFLLADSVEYRVQEVLEEKLQTILEEFGVDKTSDVLDSTQAEADFTRFHISALLNPSQIESEAEELVARLREGISLESRNLILDDVERDASQAQMLEAHPMPFWVEKLVIHAVRAEGGSAEKTLTGWNLRWKDGTEMRIPKSCDFGYDGIGAQRITLEHPRVRAILTASAITDGTTGEANTHRPRIDANRDYWYHWRIELEQQCKRIPLGLI